MRASRDAPLDELERLYRDRFGHFARVATAVTGDRDSGVDAVQEAFANVVRSRRRYRRDGPLDAWVWRAVVNAARTSRARGARRAETPLEHEPVAEGVAPETSELRSLIRRLPERQRLALFLRHYADLDYRTIAAALDVEIGTVSATLHAAHATLRRALEGVPR